MKEYLTEAIVLDQEESGEMDKKVHLYTKELGKVVAKAKSARRITSKLSCHLEPLTISQVRLIEKNGFFQIVDAVTLEKPSRSLRMIAFIHSLNALTMELVPDLALWHEIKNSLQMIAAKKFSYKPILESLGFSAKFAECGECENASVSFFSKKELMFLCKPCGVKPRQMEPSGIFPDLIEI